MADFFKSRWVLLLVLIVFIICKIPHLSYPYYWDESWPYAPSLSAMYEHGASLLPSAIDTELSRGHPLLFHASAAAWMSVFGPSNVSRHSFALFIALLVLIAVFETGVRMFNQRVAVLSLLLIATLTMFFVHSSFLLVEVMLALFCFLSLVFYTADKHILTALALTCAFYTKESGLIMGFVLGMDALVGLFKRKTEWKIRLYRLLSIGIPCMLIGVFFLVQKHMLGWYIFPLHTKLINYNWPSFWYRFRDTLKYIFNNRLKEYYFLLILELAVIAFVKHRNVKYLAPLLPGIMIYLLVDDATGSEIKASGWLLLLLLASFVAMFYLFRSLKIYTDKRQGKIMILSAIFIFLFLSFSSVNFFTFRYLMAVIVPLFFCVAVIIEKFVERTFPALGYLVVASVLVIGYYAYHFDRRFGDTDPGAFSAMDVQQKEVDYILKNRVSYTAVASGSFLTLQHLINPATGFLHGEKPFVPTSAKWYIDVGTDYIIFNNIEPDYRYKEIDTALFSLAYRYEKDSIWTEIYKRKTNK